MITAPLPRASRPVVNDNSLVLWINYYLPTIISPVISIEYPCVGLAPLAQLEKNVPITGRARSFLLLSEF